MAQRNECSSQKNKFKINLKVSQSISKLRTHLWTCAISSYDGVEKFWNITVTLKCDQWIESDNRCEVTFPLQGEGIKNKITGYEKKSCQG